MSEGQSERERVEGAIREAYLSCGVRVMEGVVFEAVVDAVLSLISAGEADVVRSQMTAAASPETRGQCEALDGRCIYVRGHSGEHYVPEDGRDQVLRDRVEAGERREAELRAEVERMKAEVRRYKTIEASDSIIQGLRAERDSLREQVKALKGEANG